MAKSHNHKGDFVLKRLLAAFARNDSVKFLEVCQRNQSTILECFDSWKVVRETIRNDPAAIEQYVHVLMLTADVFRSIGHPELFESLVDEDDFIGRWQEQISTAVELSDAGEFEKSTSILLGVLREIEGASGSAVDNWRPKILGYLGTNALHMGHFGAAREYTERARDECERTGDRNGAHIYRENLQLIRAVELRTAGSETGAHLTRIMTQIVKAQELSDTRRYQRSNEILHELLASKARGEWQSDETYLGKVYGLIGSNYFKLHETQRAREFTEMALRVCERIGDDYGAMICTSNLEVISRK